MKFYFYKNKFSFLLSNVLIFFVAVSVGYKENEDERQAEEDDEEENDQPH